MIPRILAVALLAITTPLLAKPPAPTKANVNYGDGTRQQLDFWQAPGDKPTPVVIYFHGGGFKNGDKNKVHGRIPVSRLLNNGVSVISANYPFLAHTNNDYFTILKTCESALNFVVEKSKDWRIDKDRIACSGSSAGALITQWLGYRTKHVDVMGVYAQPKGTPLLILPLIKSGAPPLLICQPSGPNDAVHHPKFAKMLKETCELRNVACTVYGSKANEFPPPPKGTNYADLMVRHFCGHWGIKPK